MGHLFVAGSGEIRRFDNNGPRPRREVRKAPVQLQLLPRLGFDADKADQKFYWLGDRAPNQFEQQLLETVFYHHYNLVWPQGHRSCWLSARRLLKHLREVVSEGGDAHTYLLIHECGLKKYLESIRDRLATEKLSCHFMALDNLDRLVAVHTHAIDANGQSQFWERWVMPPTRTKLSDGTWRRRLVLA